MSKLKVSQNRKRALFAAWGERCARCQIAPPVSVEYLDDDLPDPELLLVLCPSCRLDAQTEVLPRAEEAVLRERAADAWQRAEVLLKQSALPKLDGWPTGATAGQGTRLAHLVWQGGKLFAFSAFAPGQAFRSDTSILDEVLHKPLREHKLQEVGKQRRHLTGMQLTLGRKVEKIRDTSWPFTLGDFAIECQVSAAHCLLIRLGEKGAGLESLDQSNERLHPTRHAMAFSQKLAMLLNEYPAAIGLFPKSVAFYRLL